MAWFRVDDGFPQHRKLEALQPDPATHAAAVALWTLCGADSMGRLTDGVVTHQRLAFLVSFWPPKMRERAASALIRCGLWDTHPDGYVFHDWLDMQPSAASVTEERDRSRQRQRAWKDARRNGGGNSSGNGVGNGVTSPVATPVATGAPSRPVPVRDQISGGVSGDLVAREPAPRSEPEAAAAVRAAPDGSRMAEVAWTRVIGERGGAYAPDPSVDGPRLRSIAALVDATRGGTPLSSALEASARAHMAQRTSGRGTPQTWLEWLQRGASQGTRKAKAPPSERIAAATKRDEWQPPPAPDNVVPIGDAARAFLAAAGLKPPSSSGGEP